MRPGHHRPIGTTTKMRFPDWPRTNAPPTLGDVIAQTATSNSDPDEIERAYEVVGVEETRTGYRLVCERVPYQRWLDRLDAIAGSLIGKPDDSDAAVWTFFNLPRR